MRRWSSPIFLAFTLATTVVSAQTPDEDTLNRQGVQQRQEGHDDVAYGLFRRAYDLAHSPRAAAQMGLAEQALGRWVDADTHLREALRASADPWVGRNRVALEGALAVVARRVGSVEVTGGVPGAEIFVNGARAGALPLAAPLRVIAGTVTLEVRARGYDAQRRGVMVAADGMARENFDLVPQIESAPPTRVTSAPLLVRSVLPPAARAPEDDRALMSRSTHTTLAWAGTVGAAASIVIGGVLARARESPADRYNVGADTGRCLGTASPLDTETDTNCRSDRSAADALRTGSIVAFTVGGLLAVGSIVLFVTAPSRRSPTARARMECTPGPGDFGVACGGRF